MPEEGTATGREQPSSCFKMVRGAHNILEGKAVPSTQLMQSSSGGRSDAKPFGMIALTAVAVPLYVALVDLTMSTTIGAPSMGDAFEDLFANLGLWAVLCLMLVVGAVKGNMPRWGVAALLILVPASFVACFSGVDAYSRGLRWGVIFPAGLPLLIAAYSFWARLVSGRGWRHAQATGSTLLGAIFCLSAAALIFLVK